LVVVQGLLPLVTLWLIKRIVDTVAAQLALGPDQRSLGEIGWLIAFAGVVTLIGAVCGAAATLAREGQAQAVSHHVCDLLHAKSIEADLEYYETPQFCDTLHMAQAEAPYRPVATVHALADVAQNAVSLLAIAGIVLAFDPVVAMVLVAAVIPGMIVRFRYADRLYQMQRRHTTTERMVSYLNWILTGEAHAKEVRLFDIGAEFARRSREMRRRLRRERLEMSTQRAIKDVLTQSVAVVAVFGAFALVAVRAADGTMSVGQLVMLFMVFQRGQSSLREMFGGLALVYENSLFLENFHRFLELEPKVKDPPVPKPVVTRLQRGIEFDEVRFTYPGAVKPVLDGVNLHIAPGEHVALVGLNGSGKTTLVKLLCRLYDPQAGAIRADGDDLRRYRAAEWRRQISVVFQDFARYYLTARENIWLGNTSLTVNDLRVEAAAKLSGADAVIRKLPRSYDTVLGRTFGDGEELSIGQWQEIALARAFVRDAQIIVLDEPTSALDAEAEFHVFQQFHDLARGRTAMIISHRMSTVRMADRIIVLDGGRIAEQGRHAELMERRGTYARLFELQARNYQ
jgi:ATP-binding cassette subfamily B protein